MEEHKGTCVRANWAEEVRNWLETEEAEQLLEEADNDSQEVIRELREAIKVDVGLLQTAFTL